MWKLTKITGWLAKTIAAALLISFLSIWTTGYIVNSYVETLLKQFHIPLEEKPFALSSVWGELWGADPAVKSNGSTAADSGSDKTQAASNQDGKEKSDSVDAFSQQPSGELSDIGGGTGPKGNSSAAGTDTNTDHAGSQSQSQESADASKDEVAMTTDQLNEAKSQISDADKEKLFGVMMQKLPQDAMQTISKLMEDGLTDSEMTQVQQLMAQHLDRSEYDEMLSILSKY
ncbi:hypothetical protein [Paenibacillus sp. OV219]|uniref:hypothetical protein n=1 Tax=Paenibacillus sp. OV219 TaxID=1884377 RepID=UPI0008CBCAF1|nr:hypothetical protein [Paenibacillus sp. OV219]SEN48247.1 hypothetical protein SAMN05518847_10339 [Paenibacillus sp. OV219]